MPSDNGTETAAEWEPGYCFYCGTAFRWLVRVGKGHVYDGISDQSRIKQSGESLSLVRCHGKPVIVDASCSAA